MATISFDLGKIVPRLVGDFASLYQRYNKSKLMLFESSSGTSPDRLFLPDARVDAVSYNKTIETTKGALENGRLVTNSMIDRPSSVYVSLVAENGTTLSRIKESESRGSLFYYVANKNFAIYPMIITQVTASSMEDNLNYLNIDFVLEELELSKETLGLNGGIF